MPEQSAKMSDQDKYLNSCSDDIHNKKFSSH